MSLPGMLPFDALLPDWWLTAYVGGMVALPVLILLIFSLRILSQRRTLPVHSLLAPAQIPGELRRYGQPWIGRLGFLGFPLLACVRTEHSDTHEAVSWRLASGADQTVAILDGVLPTGGARPDFTLTLMSFLSDGRVIVTADRRLTRRPPSHWSLIEKRFQTLQQQVVDHRGLVAALRGEATAALPTPQSLPAVLAAEDQAVLDALAASGDFVPSGEEGKILRPSIVRAPLLACRELAAIFTGKAFPSGRRQDIASVGKAKSQEEEEESAPPGVAPTMEQTVEGDIRRFRALTNTPFTNKHRALRLIFLVITVVAVVAAPGKHSAVFKVLSLLGILTLHEFGHWAAMKAFGYTRMGKFFVPLVGPVNRGRKSDAAAWQQFIVILAGPLPGLFAGCILLLAGYFLPMIPRWMLDAAGLAVIYNALQLLPFLPLDGGRVVDLLVFRDLPLIRPLFTGLTAFGTLAAAYFLQAPFLYGFAACMLAGLVWDIRMLGVVRGGRKLGWSQEVKSEDEALRRIFTGVRSEQNEAFFRSSDWFQKIDVLVGEVLRKRPQMSTRIFGGAFYMATCVLPMVAMLGVIALLTKGGHLDVNQAPNAIVDFHSQFPRKTQDIPIPQLVGLARLQQATRGEETDQGHFKDAPPASERAGLAAAAAPAVLQGLDRIDWPSVGIASHQYQVNNYTLSIWLELLCGKLETATRGGKTVEATRRAEVLLFAITSLDPSPTYSGRELVRDAELRTLAAVENLAASGKLDAATLARLEGRIKLLNKAPLPEVENLLLIDGWATARGAGLMSQLAAGKTPRPEPSFEGLDWPLAYQRIHKMVRLAQLRYHDAPTIALAKYWKTSRKVGELPDHLENVASPDPGEGDFIASFCEEQRRITWRRMTTLSALSLETYRLKTGKLPTEWVHKLPEEATLALVASKGPLLQLSGRPESATPALPSWLGQGAKKEAALNYRCPLFGAAVAELSRK